MKRFICGLSLLLILFSLSFAASSAVVRRIDELAEEVRLSEETDTNDAALLFLGSAEEKWRRLEPTLHLFIRHSEVDVVSDAILEYKASLICGDRDEALWAKLMYHLDNIIYMETLSLGSIF